MSMLSSGVFTVVLCTPLIIYANPDPPSRLGKEGEAKPWGSGDLGNVRSLRGRRRGRRRRRPGKAGRRSGERRAPGNCHIAPRRPVWASGDGLDAVAEIELLQNVILLGRGRVVERTRQRANAASARGGCLAAGRPRPERLSAGFGRGWVAVRWTQTNPTPTRAEPRRDRTRPC